MSNGRRSASRGAWVAAGSSMALGLAIALPAPPAEAATASARPSTPAAARFGEGAHEKLYELVTRGQASEYRRILDEFDAHLRSNPTDSIASVERCLFIQSFAYSEEVVIESAADELEQCDAGLRQEPHASSGAARVYLWQKEWSDSDIERGEALVREYSSWTTRQRAAVHETLSRRYGATDEIKAGEHALKAVEIDESSRMRLSAAEHLVRIGAKRRAVGMVEGVPEWTHWTLSSGLKILIGLGEAQAASRLARAHQDIELDARTRLQIGRAMIEAGESQAGRALVARLIDGTPLPEHHGIEPERELFEFQLEHGDARQAEQAFRALRDKGYEGDPFGRRRVALTMQHPTAPWRWADLPGLGALLLILGVVALAPVLVVAPVHYRSAVKQLRGFTPAPLSDGSPWTLANLWYALAAVECIGLLALYAFSYADFEAAFADLFAAGTWREGLSDERALGRTTWWGVLLTLVALLPLLWRKRIGALLLGEWGVLRSLLVGASAAIMLLFVIRIVTMLFRTGPPAGFGLGTDTMRSMQGIYSLYGGFALVTCMAVLVPIVEELVFRGVVLRSMARHVALWAAVVVQSMLFMLWHEDVSTYPQVLAIGLVASWLAVSSRGLLAPITLHVVINAIAAITLIAVTRAIDAPVPPH